MVPSAKEEPALGVTLKVAEPEAITFAPSVFLNVTLVEALVTVPRSIVFPSLARSMVASPVVAVP